MKKNITIIILCSAALLGFVLVSSFLELGFNYSGISLMGIVTFFVAGAVDGINPCALGVLIFLLTVLLNKKNNSNLFLYGLVFALGTFITYFLFGIGVLGFFTGLVFGHSLNVYFYFFGACLCFLFFALNAKDAVMAKRQEIDKITLQLPNKNKKLIHNIINSFIDGKAGFFTMFLLGVLTTLTEILCTGQIYIMALVSLSSMEMLVRVGYLLIFNLGFVLPIITICFLVQKTKDTMMAGEVFYGKIWIIKLVTSILMLGFGLYLFAKII